MMDSALLLALCLAAYLGFAFLALSQARHWRAARGHAAARPAARVALRVCGAGCLLSALGLALLRDGPSFGALLWATAISLAAAAVACTLSAAPALLRPLASVTAMCAGTQPREERGDSLENRPSQ